MQTPQPTFADLPAPRPPRKRGRLTSTRWLETSTPCGPCSGILTLSLPLTPPNATAATWTSTLGAWTSCSRRSETYRPMLTRQKGRRRHRSERLLELLVIRTSPAILVTPPTRTLGSATWPAAPRVLRHATAYMWTSSLGRSRASTAVLASWRTRTLTTDTTMRPSVPTSVPSRAGVHAVKSPLSSLSSSAPWDSSPSLRPACSTTS